jgi:uncharacterized protein DUF4012
VLKLVLLAAAMLVLGIVAAAADAYYQSFKVYRDVRVVLPNLRQASDYLAKGQLPPGDPFGRADATVRRAAQEVDHARFTFKLTGALPFLGRPVDAVRHGVAAASRVTRAALITQDAVSDLLGGAASSPGTVPAADTPLYRGGEVNVDLLAGVTPRLEQVISHLRAANSEIRAIPSLPLVPGVDEAKRQAIADSTRAIRLADRVLSGVRLLPSFLGSEGVRTYFVALENEAEVRAPGGSILAYGIVTVDRGHFELIAGGGVNDLRVDPRILEPGAPQREVDVPLPPTVAWYIDHIREAYPWPGTVNYSPDFPMTALAWARMVEKATGKSIDGVIAMDQTAVARVLGSRKIRVPAFPGAITGRNLAKVVGHDQYLLPLSQQIAFPGQLIAAAWPTILDPGPLQEFLNTLGDSLHEKRIQLWSGDRELQSLMGRLGWDGAVRVREGDYLYVVDDKIVPNKVDYYSRISIDYRVTIDASGNGTSALDVTLTNDSPPGLPISIAGRPASVGGYAVNRALMLAFVPQGAELVSAEPRTGLPDHVEAGAKVFARTIRAGAGEAAIMELRYRVPGLVTSARGRKVYRLTVQQQPMLHPAALTVTVTLPKGTTVSAVPPGWTIKGNVLTLETQLTHDMVHEIAF